jgi:hypothetical protein
MDSSELFYVAARCKKKMVKILLVNLHKPQTLETTATIKEAVYGFEPTLHDFHAVIMDTMEIKPDWYSGLVMVNGLWVRMHGVDTLC